MLLEFAALVNYFFQENIWIFHFKSIEPSWSVYQLANRFAEKQIFTPKMEDWGLKVNLFSLNFFSSFSGIENVLMLLLVFSISVL